MKTSSPLFYLCVCLILIFFIILPHLLNSFDTPLIHQHHALDIVQPQQDDDDYNDNNCDIFTGHWIRDTNAPWYENRSCVTLPESKNCFKYGRLDTDFIKWRWKPNSCQLSRFNPKMFLKIVRGKKMAFIGDSVARNHMDSLLCLLSKEEIPVNKYKDSEDRFITWHFPRHDFTIMMLWTKFLVAEDEIIINGTASSFYNLHLDKLNEHWTQKLPAGMDYAVLSSGHWFSRKLYLHKCGALIGCVYCNEPNITDRGLSFALKMSFRSALNYLNDREDLKGLMTLLRTFSPSHFEQGGWNSGGKCNRTSPLSELDTKDWSVLSSLEQRRVQVEEIERAKEVRQGGKSFEVLDVTKAMLMRPDGHPNSHYENRWNQGFNDCIHWCLPGPVDAWNDFLFAVLLKETGHFYPST